MTRLSKYHQNNDGMHMAFEFLSQPPRGSVDAFTHGVSPDGLVDAMSRLGDRLMLTSTVVLGHIPIDEGEMILRAIDVPRLRRAVCPARVLLVADTELVVSNKDFRKSHGAKWALWRGDSELRILGGGECIRFRGQHQQPKDINPLVASSIEGYAGGSFRRGFLEVHRNTKRSILRQKTPIATLHETRLASDL